MRRPIAAATALFTLTVSAAAHAQAPAPPRPKEVPEDFPRLVLDDGRIAPTPADAEHLRLQVHGEYQLRLQGQSSFALTPTASLLNGSPGATGDSIGQNAFLWHWLRLTPRFQIKDKIQIVAQADLVGLVLGDTTHDVGADMTPRDDHDAFKNVQPRWLYLEWLTPVGLLRVGQQPSHWGMGIVANDGDHASLFGDYRYGNMVDEILFATKPGGKDSPFVVAAAGGIVYRDNVARITRGDHAWQGILAAFYEEGPNMLGVYGVYRNQTRDKTSGSDIFPFTESLEVGVVDVAGHFAAPVKTPGAPMFVFGSGEAATIFGSTNAERTLDQTTGGTTTTVRQYGGAVAAGFVIGAHAQAMPAPSPNDPMAPRPRPELFGRFVSQIEVGYASGDADPYDGTERRFVFDPNHKVGLLLFDEVMRWQTARAATAARDPLLTNANNPPPGVDLLPSNGGVFGAQYIYPTMIYRPLHWLDVKGGAVIAQTTADYVDPYRVATQGAYVNYRGGDSRRHDLGVELDGGLEARIPIEAWVRLQVGAQAGVLFPGGALADAAGTKLKTPTIAIGRVGIQF